MQVSPSTNTRPHPLLPLAVAALLCLCGLCGSQTTALASKRQASPKPSSAPAASQPRPNPKRTQGQATSRKATTKPRPASRPALPHEAARGCMEGRVLGPQGKPLAQAQVTTMPPSSEKMTGKDGRFMICFRRLLHHAKEIVRKRLPRGPIELIIRKFGHYTQRRNLWFRQRKLVVPDVRLKAIVGPLCVATMPTQTKGQVHGKERRCWPSGAQMLLRSWHKGRRHGLFLYTGPSGQLYERSHYRYGKRHGEYTRWDHKGSKTCQRRWSQPQTTGAWRCPHPKHKTKPSSRPAQKTPPLAPKATTKDPLPKAFSQLKPEEQGALLTAIAQDPSPHKLNTRPWLAWIRAGSANNRLVRPFLVPAHYTKGLVLQIVALGEQKHQRIVDGAWLQRRDTGQIVWRMRFQNTRSFGPDSRHRLANQRLRLPPGSYLLHYKTDATHDPGHWITPPPPQAHRYGVVLYIPSSRGYARLNR